MHFTELLGDNRLKSSHLAIVDGAKNGDDEKREEDIEANLQPEPELRVGVSGGGAGPD